MTLREALITAERRLAAAGCDTPGLDARVLLGHVTGFSEAGLIAHDRDPLGDAEAAYESLVSRRERREPVAYVTEEKEFYSLVFRVGPEVLVPRPETELLVEQALEFLSASPGARWVVDVGTGSGAVAIALRHELRARRGLAILGIDCADPALAVARGNAARVVPGSTPGALDFVRADLTRALAPGSVDLVVSNPPYLTRAELDGAPPELGFEPRGALEGGGDDGLALVRALLLDAARVLRPGGRLLCEIGHQQGKVARRAAEGLGFDRVQVLRDLAGRPRVLRGDAKGAQHVAEGMARSREGVDGSPSRRGDG